MLRIALINPPNHLFDRFELAPPLGLLTLAKIAINEGYEPRLFDFALPKYDDETQWRTELLHHCS